MLSCISRTRSHNVVGIKKLKTASTHHERRRARYNDLLASQNTKLRSGYCIYGWGWVMHIWHIWSKHYYNILSLTSYKVFTILRCYAIDVKGSVNFCNRISSECRDAADDVQDGITLTLREIVKLSNPIFKK